MRSHFRIVIGSVIGIMILLLGFHVGGPSLLPVARYSQLIGCLIGGSMVLVSVRMPIRPEENVEPWLKREQLAWTIIGCGFIPWFIAESFWRYY